MKEIDIKGKHIVMWDAVEEMPIERWNKFTKYMMLDAGLGGGMGGAENHLQKAIQLLNDKKSETSLKQAKTELQNLMQNVHLINAGVNPQSLAFAVCIKSIDGKECADISDDGVKQTAEVFNSLMSMKEQHGIVDRLKKKFKVSLQRISPRHTHRASKSRTIADSSERE